MIESFMMMNMYLHSSLLQAVCQDAGIDQMHRQTALTTEYDAVLEFSERQTSTKCKNVHTACSWIFRYNVR